MKTVLRPCSACGGSGKVELTGLYADALELLARQSTELNAAALARQVGCEPTAMCNRLVALERMGLAVGRRHGRQRLWRAVKK